MVIEFYPMLPLQSLPHFPLSFLPTFNRLLVKNKDENIHKNAIGQMIGT